MSYNGGGLNWDQVNSPNFSDSNQSFALAAKLLDDAIGKGINLNNTITQNRSDAQERGLLGNLYKFNKGEDAMAALNSGDLYNGIDTNQLSLEAMRDIPNLIGNLYDLEGKGIKNTQGYLDHDLTKANTGNVKASTAATYANMARNKAEDQRKEMNRLYDQKVLAATNGMNAEQRMAFFNSDAHKAILAETGVGFAKANDAYTNANNYYDTFDRSVRSTVSEKAKEEYDAANRASEIVQNISRSSKTKEENSINSLKLLSDAINDPNISNTQYKALESAIENSGVDISPLKLTSSTLGNNENNALMAAGISDQDLAEVFAGTVHGGTDPYSMAQKEAEAEAATNNDPNVIYSKENILNPENDLTEDWYKEKAGVKPLPKPDEDIPLNLDPNVMAEFMYYSDGGSINDLLARLKYNQPGVPSLDVANRKGKSPFKHHDLYVLADYYEKKEGISRQEAMKKVLNMPLDEKMYTEFNKIISQQTRARQQSNPNYMKKVEQENTKQVNAVKRELAELFKDKHAEATKIANTMEFDSPLEKEIYTSKLAQKLGLEQYENSRKAKDMPDVGRDPQAEAYNRLKLIHKDGSNIDSMVSEAKEKTSAATSIINGPDYVDRETFKDVGNNVADITKAVIEDSANPKASEKAETVHKNLQEILALTGGDGQLAGAIYKAIGSPMRDLKPSDREKIKKIAKGNTSSYDKVHDKEKLNTYKSTIEKEAEILHSLKNYFNEVAKNVRYGSAEDKNKALRAIEGQMMQSIMRANAAREGLSTIYDKYAASTEIGKSIK